MKIKFKKLKHDSCSGTVTFEAEAWGGCDWSGCSHTFTCSKCGELEENE